MNETEQSTSTSAPEYTPNTCPHCHQYIHTWALALPYGPYHKACWTEAVLPTLSDEERKLIALRLLARRWRMGSVDLDHILAWGLRNLGFLDTVRSLYKLHLEWADRLDKL